MLKLKKSYILNKTFFGSKVRTQLAVRTQKACYCISLVDVISCYIKSTERCFVITHELDNKISFMLE